jgi:hypothetical protein
MTSAPRRDEIAAGIVGRHRELDKASGPALVLCTADGRTHVTAVTE